MTTTTQTSFAVGSSAFRGAQEVSGPILDVESVWKHAVYQVWIPRLATVERIRVEWPSLAQPTNPASTSHRNKLARQRDNLPQRWTEPQAYGDERCHYGEMANNPDLDSRAKVSHGKFSELLGELKAVCDTDDGKCPLREHATNSDRKKTTGELHGGMETLCAFLNGVGGKVLFGVTNAAGIARKEHANHAEKIEWIGAPFRVRSAREAKENEDANDSGG